MGAELAKGAKGLGDSLVARLKVLRPELPILRVHSTPVSGLVALELPGGQVLYGTEDGKHLISGDLYALENDIVNLTEVTKSAYRKGLLAEMDKETLLAFKPDETKSVINVFTDVDCTYCRRLHADMDKLNELGIEVRYLAYPRAGIGSPAYDKIVSAWCADNPQGALTELKLGRSIPSNSCSNPVADHYDLGRRIGISGTPAILTEDGQLFPGYMPPEQLAAAIGLPQT